MQVVIEQLAFNNWHRTQHRERKCVQIMKTAFLKPSARQTFTKNLRRVTLVSAATSEVVTDIDGHIKCVQHQKQPKMTLILCSPNEGRGGL